jgi:CRISPR/Cas system CSM-associated protein Csm2 small subunit
MSISTEQRIELQVQRAIRQSEDDLVTWIQDALDKTKYGDLEESQFRNLVRVSDTTDSAEVIKNFIRYQVGRDKKWGRGQESLAERIIQDIDGNIKKTAGMIAECSQIDFKPIWLELIRRYLGYGSRHLKYLRDGKKL